MFTSGYPSAVPGMVHPATAGIGILDPLLATGSPASGTIVSGVHYYPIALPTVCIARRVWWLNGATTTGGATIEAGIYRDSGYGPGVRLVYGSATQGTASEIQFVDVTDTTLVPEVYWLGIVASTTSLTTMSRSAYGAIEESAKFQETGTALPATATPVAATSTAFYVFGFSTTTIT